MADDETIDDQVDEDEDDGGGVFGKLLVLAGLAGVASFLLKRKREQELDEALWEEPRPV